MKLTALLLSIIFLSSASAQLDEKKVIVPPQFRSVIDTNKTLSIPNEYEISVFYAGNLKRPRFLAHGPKNTVYVADMNAGNILALPDADHNGIADSAIVVCSGLDTAHSLAFYHDTMYVAEPTRIRKFIDNNGDGIYETELPFITGIGATGPYNHFTRTILIDTIGKHIYVSVGASCNACRESDTERGTILQFNLDGSGRKVFASGLRNALGLAMNPDNNELWAANADRDNLGDEIPPEIITSVHQNNFFGWPFAYGAKQWVDFQSAPEYQAMLPVTAADSVRVNAMREADIFLPAHSTPMAMIFYDDPRTYIQAPPLTAFVAVHGSSPGGRKVGLGYKVIELVYDKFAATWSTSDFLTGFLTDSINYTYWGRPCGLVQDSSGDIFLSTDAGIPAIYRIHLTDQNAVKNNTVVRPSLKIFPNPAASSAIITYALDHYQNIKLELVDQLGKVIRIIANGNEEAGEKNISFPTQELPEGIYYLRLEKEGSTISTKFINMR
jgi:glucose/arabinose dehydrogenase